MITKLRNYTTHQKLHRIYEVRATTRMHFRLPVILFALTTFYDVTHCQLAQFYPVSDVIERLEASKALTATKSIRIMSFAIFYSGICMRRFVSGHLFYEWNWHPLTGFTLKWTLGKYRRVNLTTVRTSILDFRWNKNDGFHKMFLTVRTTLRGMSLKVKAS